MSEEEIIKLPPGFKGNLSEEQAKILSEMKAYVRKSELLMSTLLHPLSTTFLLRFLRARSFHLKKSIDMLEAYAKYIIDEHIWDIKMETVIELCDNPTIKWMGFDKLGRGTFIITPGHHVPGSMEYTLLGPMLCMVLFLACQELKDPKQTLCLIFSYKGWGLKNVDSKLDREMMTVAQDMMPERLGKAFFVSPPWYFSTVWSVCKHFLHQDTRDKFEFLSRNPEKTLLEAFHEDVLLESLGGKKSEAETIRKFLEDRMKPEQTLRECLLERDILLNLNYDSEEED